MPLNNVPLNNVPLNNVPLNNVPLNNVPLNNVPLNESPGQESASRSRQLADAYDTATRPFDAFRRRAVRLLELRPGQVVLDVGCGTGRCLRYLEEAVGDSGRVVGIDGSGDMLAEARMLVSENHWDNVTLVESSVETAAIPVQADAALFCAVHDLLQSPEAIANALMHLRPGGRVVATGGKWANSWLPALNLSVAILHGPYVRSFDGFDCPWEQLGAFLDEPQVRSIALGTGYLLVGTHSRWKSRQVDMTAGNDPGGNSNASEAAAG